MYAHSGYLVVLSPVVITASSSTIQRNVVPRAKTNTQGTAADAMQLTLFDPENKLIAYSGTFEGGVRDAVSQGGRLYVVTNDGQVGILFESYCPLFKPRAASVSFRNTDFTKAGCTLLQKFAPHRFEHSSIVSALRTCYCRDLQSLR